MEVVSAEIGDYIGSGRCCDVYTWGKGWVIKLFQPGADRGWIENEARVSALIHSAGLPAPAVGDIVEIGDRVGITFEHIEGRLLADEVLENPRNAVKLAREFGELHALVHSKKVSGLPSQKAAMERSVLRAEELTQEVKGAVLGILSRLPDGDEVCHGDLNLKNVIVSPSGMVIIDWDNCKRGNPAGDVARAVLMLDQSEYHVKEPAMVPAVKELAATFRDAYLDRYFEVAGGDPGVIRDWMAPVAAARLREGIEVEQAALLALVLEGVKREGVA